MSRKNVIPVALMVVLLLIAALALSGCSSSTTTPAASSVSSPTGGDLPNPVDQGVNGMKDQANQAVRDANLRIIDAACQAYNAENGTWPTDISQLSQYMPRGVPQDPAGGTYYIYNDGTEAKAGVR